MKKYIPISVCVALILAGGSAAHAGAQWIDTLYFAKNADGSGSVQGSLASVRNSIGDSVSQFGCYHIAYPGGYQYSSCYATDGTHSLACGTADPTLNDTISKLQGDQYLYFAVDTQGNCTSVETGSQSMFPPKQL